MAYESPSPKLQAFINKTLRVTTTDDRFFVGDLKCTDRACPHYNPHNYKLMLAEQDRNLILSATSEYRYPSGREVLQQGQKEGSIKMDIKSRFIGLAVVPGNVIAKIEVEEKGPATARRGWAFGAFAEKKET